MGEKEKAKEEMVDKNRKFLLVTKIILSATHSDNVGGIFHPANIRNYF